MGILIKKLVKFLLPFNCILCKLPSDRQQDLCSNCLENLPFYPDSCKRCGKIITYSNNNNSIVCGSCLIDPPPFDTTLILFQFISPIKQMISQLKFNANLTYARILGELLTTKISQVYTSKKLPDLLISVPMHPKKIKNRGFNQTIEIARPIVNKLKIPIKNNICQRIRNTPPQTNFTANYRKKNVKNAFLATKSIPAAHIAIVEDIITTGSTIKSLSYTLKKAGAQRIDIWSLATGFDQNIKF